jgi:membrane fusion protein
LSCCGTMSSLFREEAIQAEQTPLYASPLAIRAVTATRLMVVLLFIVALLIAFAALAHFNKKEHVSGYLTTEEGDAVIVAPIAGAVTEVFVTENTVVKKGDPLFSMSAEVAAGKGDADAQLDSQLLRKEEALNMEIASLKVTGMAEKTQLQGRIALLDGSLSQSKVDQLRLHSIGALSQKVLDKQQDLVSRGYVAELSLIDKQRDKLEVDARIAAAVQAALALQRERAQLVSDLSTVERRIESTLAPRKREALSIEQAKTELTYSRTRMVLAPREGVVSGLVAKVGAAAAGGEPLLRLTTRGVPLIATLRISPQARGTVLIGQNVLLQYTSFPHRDYGQARAVITQISEAPVDSPEQSSANPQGQPKATVYLVNASLLSQSVTSRKGEVFPLKTGMVLEADIVIERRSLLAWLFSPLLDARNG